MLVVKVPAWSVTGWATGSIAGAVLLKVKLDPNPKASLVGMLPNWIASLPPCAGQDLPPRATKKPNDINPRFRYRPGGLNDLLRVPADLNAFTASLAVIATDVLKWEIPPDAAPAISAEAMTSSFGASAIERKSYSPNVK